jgi:hypothetical protein
VPLRRGRGARAATPRTRSQHYAMMHSISAMQENQHKSPEEIRFEAYAKAGEPAAPGASPQGAFGQQPGGGAPGAFGASPTSAFGTAPGGGGGFFGAPASLLGGATGGAFGAQPGAAGSPFGGGGGWQPVGGFGASPEGAANPFG